MIASCINSLWNTNNSKINSNLLYDYKIIKIQKIYKGYRCRNKLNNIYKKLPIDIQDIIDYYINKLFYIKKQEKKIKTIINRKISSYNIEMINLFNDTYIDFDINKFLNYQNNILDIFYLFEKYYILLDEEIINIFKKNNIILYNLILNCQDILVIDNLSIEEKKLKLDIIIGLIIYDYNYL